MSELTGAGPICLAQELYSLLEKLVAFVHLLKRILALTVFECISNVPTSRPASALLPVIYGVQTPKLRR